MSTADKIDDSWPHTHGTVDGYDNGCRGGSCPAGDEYGLSCKLAKSLSRSDYKYSRLVKGGATVAAIAAEFDLVGTSAPATATPKPKSKPAPKPKPAQAPAQPAAAAVPAVPTPVVVDVEPTSEPDASVSAVSPAPTAQEVRQWAHDRGYEIPAFGRIPKHIRAHYDDAHAIGTGAPPVDEPPVAGAADVLTAAREIRELVGHPGDYPTPTQPESTERARPEWGQVALHEDLQKAHAATAAALEERDRARDLAARLFEELHRAETTATEHRERASAALADYMRDLGQLEQERNQAWSEQAALLGELSVARDALRTTETALDLTLRKWGQLKTENRFLRAWPAPAEGTYR